MNRLPGTPARQPHATPAGQPTPDALAFLADIEQALAQANKPEQPTPTAYRDDTLPAAYTIGPTPPIPQEGRPPMSQKAVDASTLMLSAGAASIPLGGMTALILYVIGHADPTSLAIGAAAPISLAVPVFALSRLLGRAKAVVEAAPPVIHHHYNGPVTQDQRTVNSTNRGIWATTRNQLPPSNDQQPQGKHL